jgi:dihydrofolate reductase
MINLILAVDQNWGIGNSNKLLFHFSSDLKRFKELTTGSHVVMGRKTWESLPNKLPNRTNVVISRASVLEKTPDLIFNTIEPVLKISETEDVWVIGGAEITKMFMPYIDTIALTKVYTEREADVNVRFMEEYLSDFMVYSSTSQKEIDKISNTEINFDYITLVRTSGFN